MIAPSKLLDDCKRLMGRLEADLIARSHGKDALPEVVESLLSEFQQAKDAKRTAQNFEDWRTEYATQQAAAWILSAVFVRFLEDNELIDPPRIAGPDERLRHARDQHELYFRAHPTETDREYLLHVFQEVGKLPGGREVFGKHNNVFELPHWLSGDAAGGILQFFQRVDADTGALVHDFTDPEWDTRFLGDLYQDLSEGARKKFALLQTPEFVEEFILDRTLDPALDEFGLDAPPVTNRDGDAITDAGFRMIDPACGSGHFLLGAFRRILDRWQRKEPGTNVRDLVQRTLTAVNGCDLNPYATAIVRFRLLLAALKACGIRRPKESPAFHFNLATGDSLLHGAPGVEQQLLAFDPLAHHFYAEDIDALRKILRPGTYHAVVANPPYIAVQDAILRDEYRKRYMSCHGRYVLTVPFMERIFHLAVHGGYTGQITSNSFMKREFGKKLIENFMPTVDLTHVIDTSGAYIPGHGTPTVILFARHRPPVSSIIRTVLGIRGEPSTPEDPARGLVWTAIIDQIDRPGSESAYVSAGDSARGLFHSHPWSIGGGGAAELKEITQDSCEITLGIIVDAIGVMAIAGEDEVYISDRSRAFHRAGITQILLRPLVLGDQVRDWTLGNLPTCIYPYDGSGTFTGVANAEKHFWVYRATLVSGVYFGKTKGQRGLDWRDYGILVKDKLLAPLSIVYAEVATHNHFVLDRGGKVFKQTAPVIKLPAGATEDDHLALLGLLNSSTACFWMKQVCHCKGSTVDQHGARQTTVPFEDFYAYNATQMERFPLPSQRPMSVSRSLDRLVRTLAELVPTSVLAQWNRSPDETLREALHNARDAHTHIQRHMVGLQEELDWECYQLYGLIDEALTHPCAIDDPVDVELGQRAFEIHTARKMAGGEIETTWFVRHGSTPITKLPAQWPEDYKQLIERRIERIESDKNIGLIERPEYKRRWNAEPWEVMQQNALREWLLSRLESHFDFDGRMNDAGKPTAKRDIAVCSVAQLADLARQDSKFMEAAELYTDDPAFDVVQLVTELVENESVPHFPVLRYKPSGLRKREEWETTWDLQRQEDAIDARTKLPVDDPQFLSPNESDRLKRKQVGDIPVPPKYTSTDFLASHYWRLRGKLDVPKERWVSFPHCEGQDGTLTFAWAGYDHLQLARAVSAHYVDVQERIGGRDDPRLVPLLASLIELLPWLKQWHNDVDPEFNMAMGDYFEGFIQEEARNLGMTLDQIRAWQPPQTTRRARRRTRRGAQ